MAEIRTPVKGFTGKVAGVQFTDGVGETVDAAALAYFERHGYTVAPTGAKEQAIPTEATGEATPVDEKPAVEATEEPGTPQEGAPVSESEVIPTVDAEEAPIVDEKPKPGRGRKA